VHCSEPALLSKECRLAANRGIAPGCNDNNEYRRTQRKEKATKMNIIFVPRRAGRKGTYRLKSNAFYALATLFAILPVVLAAGGYLLGKENSDMGPTALLSTLKKELNEQRGEVKEARRMTSETMDALAMRLGKLQAHVIRLDALGGRLTKMAKLDSGEFDFTADPAQGGPETTADADGPWTPCRGSWMTAPSNWACWKVY
jgi:hypothetical protein